MKPNRPFNRPSPRIVRLFTFLSLALCCLPGMVTMSVFAEDEPLQVNKTITPVADRLNAWNVTLEVSVPAATTVTDTVLVVDRGVAPGGDFNALRDELKRFVETFFGAAPERSRLAMVAFGDDAAVIQDFTGSDGQTSFLDAIDALTESETANAQAGLHLARSLFDMTGDARKNLVMILNRAPNASYAITNPNEYSLNLGNRLVTNTIIPDFAFNYNMIIADGQVYPDTAPAVTSSAVNSLIAESVPVRADGITIFTVSNRDGIAPGTLAGTTTGSENYYEPDAANLSVTLKEVAAACLGLPRSIRYTEQIGQGFEVPDDLVAEISASSGQVAYNLKSDVFTWEPGPILDREVRTLTYTIRPTKDILQVVSPGDNAYRTVASGTFSYRTGTSEPQLLTVVAPTVNPVFVRIDNHLLDGLNRTVYAPDRKFTIRLTRDGRILDYEIGAYETKIIPDLELPGEYAVSEIATNQGEIADYDITITPATFTLSPDHDAPVVLTVVNRLKALGKLTVNQELVDPTGKAITADTRKFKFRIEGPGAYVKQVTITESESAELTDLIYGDYLITQVDLEDDFSAVAGPYNGIVTLTETEKEGEATFVNRFTPPTTEVTGAFTWQDGPDKHPDLTVNLLQNDVVAADLQQVISSGTDSYTWEDIPATDLHGEPIAYRIALAEPVPNYETTNPDDLTIHQQYVIPTDGAAKATVDWHDGPKDKPTIALRLMRSAGTGSPEAVPNAAPVELSGETKEASWRDLDRTSLSGVPYRFSVQQGVLQDGEFVAQTLADYDTTIDGLTVSNQYVVRRDGSVEIAVNWVNGNPKNRPTVFVRLYRQLTERAEPRVVPDTTILEVPGGQETISWNNVEKTTITGEPYLFTVRQVNPKGDDFTPPNYEKKEDGLTITNTYVIPATAKASATVAWVDGPEKKPAVWLELTRRRETSEDDYETVPNVAPVEIVGETLKADWTNLEETDLNGEKYAFSVRVGTVKDGSFSEIAPEQYSVAIDGLAVTNTYAVATDARASAEIDWIDGPKDNRPTVFLRLLRQVGSARPENVPELSPLKVENGETTVTWEGLEATDRQGNPFTFSVQQVTASGTVFEPTDYRTETNGMLVTNRYVIPTDGEINGEVVWRNGPDDRPTVYLQPLRALPGMDPETIPDTEVIELVDGKTSASWTDLEKTDLAGTPYVFTVLEGELDENGEFIASNPPSYKKVEKGTVVTNTYIIPTDGSATATVKWENGPADARPPVYLRLYRRVSARASEMVPDADVLTVTAPATEVTWTGLESTDIDGAPYIFSVAEVDETGEEGAPENYVATVNGLNVTNTYVVPRNIEVEATVQWVDGDPENRPAMQLALYRSIEGGELELVPVQPRVRLVEETDTAAWKGLEASDLNGNAYTFTVRNVNNMGAETALPDYKTKITGMTVENSYVIPKTASATAEVKWVDGPNENRPPVWVRLFRQSAVDGIAEPVPDAEILPVPDGETTVEWEGLEATDLSGKPYDFSVHLVNATGEIFFLANYEKDETGMTITNTYIVPTYGSAEAHVLWIDGDPKNRPDIWLQLRRALIGEPAEPVPGVDLVKLENEMDTVRWENLEATDRDGNLYIFSAGEVDAAGLDATPQYYVKSENGLSIVNTYEIPYDFDAVARVVWEGGATSRPTVRLRLLRKLGEAGAFEVVPDLEPKSVGSGLTTATWTGLQRTDISGMPFIYTVEMIDADGNPAEQELYDTVIDGLTVTNTFIVPKTGSQRGIVQWVNGPKDNRPTVWLKLQRQIGQAGIPEDVPDTDVKMLENGETSVVWDELAETDIYGNEYIFTVQLVDASGEVMTHPQYRKKLSGPIVINTYIIPTDGVAEAAVVWVDGPVDDRPMTWLRLYRRVGDGAEMVVPGSAMASLANGATTARWENLESTDDAGMPYIFSVRQVDQQGNNAVPADYKKEENGLTVTNTYVIPKDGSAEAKVVWVGAGKDVPTVFFKLYRQVDGGDVEEVPDAILKQLNGTVSTASWTGLESTDSAGRYYNFSVREVNAFGLDFEPEGFTKTEDGLTVTNTRKR